MYLTLQEAAEVASQRKNCRISKTLLLRAGGLGVLMMGAMFEPCRALDKVRGVEVELGRTFLFLLPGHFREIERDGITRAKLALDEATVTTYSLESSFTADQLLVRPKDLEAAIPMLLVDEEALQRLEKFQPKGRGKGPMARLILRVLPTVDAEAKAPAATVWLACSRANKTRSLEFINDSAGQPDHVWVKEQGAVPYARFRVAVSECRRSLKARQA